MILRLDNFKLGIDWWEKYGWGSDYINREYYEMYSARSTGITREWWSATVKRLWDWLAIRGPKPPNSKAEIMERGLPRLDRIASEYSKLVERASGEPKFTAASWEDVSPLFYCALSSSQCRGCSQARCVTFCFQTCSWSWITRGLVFSSTSFIGAECRVNGAGLGKKVRLSKSSGRQSSRKWQFIHCIPTKRRS